MSMPVATYKCSACDLSRWSSGTWGYRYYLHGESKLQMHVVMGWCKTCNDLQAIEVLPDAEGELKLKIKLEALQAELAKVLAATPPAKSWWPFRAKKISSQANLEYEIRAAEEQIMEYRLCRTALSTRTGKPRCLRCESEDCIALPEHAVDYFAAEDVPVPIGFMHPGCGGQLTVAYEGTRLSVQLTEKAYDLEGHLLDEVKPRSS
ncbi:hypothetical protein SAMN05216296_2423 [Pseudomonas pohangensis]|uniref:Uncharacterized protein n=1 Tax=Pseudomonas pohangensis TaxID=364197 RepID=A0A1H2GNM6_9PSED|nr:hypothetical protein [Pseudomonas pohangensis]SDU21154.1 hypothetical protein SAMN05216296_2423 [Pseudomonas pohangensis]